MTRRIVITGGPGFGKSSIITELEGLGYRVYPEVARQIIQEEIENQGDTTPWQDVLKFSDRVHQGRRQQFHDGEGRLSFYDRGIPDIAAFLNKDRLQPSEALLEDCRLLRYDTPIFITPPWEAIFRQDAERKEDFVTAAKVHKSLEAIYLDLGYQLIPVPMASIRGRANFILQALGEHTPAF